MATMIGKKLSIHFISGRTQEYLLPVGWNLTPTQLRKLAEPGAISTLRIDGGTVLIKGSTVAHISCVNCERTPHDDSPFGAYGEDEV